MLEAEFSGWICWHDRYDPAYMGYDEVVEILEEILEVITAARAKEILETKKITPDEQKFLKDYVLADVAESAGEETSYWIGSHPNQNVKAFVGLYQYEDGSREIADVFEDYIQACQFGEKAGFDLVGV